VCVKVVPENFGDILSTLIDLFPPTFADAEHRITLIKPRAYASTRNFLNGAVTRLSPYITHGFVSLADIAPLIEAKYPVEECEKLLMEFGWREFFQHVWRHLGDGVLRDVKPGLYGINYSPDFPADIAEARTGIPAIDCAVRELYETGYLHNHARMWLASYVVHMRKVHWRAGADWMIAHLLDGDFGSNHLSWQWVAGTFSGKPYLFNAENVARYAPDWSSAGTAIDTSYEALDEIARSQKTMDIHPSARKLEATLLPTLSAQPVDNLINADARKSAPVLASEVMLIHPWDLADPAIVEANQKQRLGIIHLPFHAEFPWSERRWNFVMTRMLEVADDIFVGDVSELIRENKNIKFGATATYNFGYREALSASNTLLSPIRRFTQDPEKMCGSFTKFWAAIGRQRVDRDLRNGRRKS
jgi:deoxyribodipyrimidine photo-lyase